MRKRVHLIFVLTSTHSLRFLGKQGRHDKELIHRRRFTSPSPISYLLFLIRYHCSRTLSYPPPDTQIYPHSTHTEGRRAKDENKTRARHLKVEDDEEIEMMETAVERAAGRGGGRKEWMCLYVCVCLPPCPFLILPTPFLPPKKYSSQHRHQETEGGRQKLWEAKEKDDTHTLRAASAALPSSSLILSFLARFVLAIERPAFSKNLFVAR